MSRIGHLSILLCLMILSSLLATGCSTDSFTLIGSVNLGGEDSQVVSDQSSDDEADQPIGDLPDISCWPSAKAAFAEMVAHGFTPKKWPETETWFRRLESVKQQLPPCES